MTTFLTLIFCAGFDGFQPWCRTRSRSLNDSDGLVELESHHRLGWDTDRAALDQDLSQCATSCAGAGSDRCAFPPARDGADNGADGSSTACIFGGSLVRAKPLLAAFSDIAAANEVLLTLYRNRLQVQYKIGGAMEASSFRHRPDDDLSVRTVRNDHIPIGVENVVGDFGRIGLAFDGSGRVDRVFAAH